MVELPFLKITELYIRKNSAQTTKDSFELAKNYEQQTTKHLLNSKSS